MSHKKIQELLNRLNEDLDKLDATDKKSKAKLSRLIHKIKHKLGGPGHSKQENPLANEIKDVVIHFEIKHPVIAETLAEIKTALYSIGL
jgi:hypothetical protein